MGAKGVQIATRFVTTKECDASDAYKQAYIDARKEDIVLVDRPALHCIHQRICNTIWDCRWIAGNNTLFTAFDKPFSGSYPLQKGIVNCQ